MIFVQNRGKSQPFEPMREENIANGVVNSFQTNLNIEQSFLAKRIGQFPRSRGIHFFQITQKVLHFLCYTKSEINWFAGRLLLKTFSYLCSLKTNTLY